MKLDGLMYLISNIRSIAGRENLLINHHPEAHVEKIAEPRSHLGVYQFQW